ncbi:hypothetical protein LABO110987_03175 [Lactobacillus bombicola]
MNKLNKSKFYICNNKDLGKINSGVKRATMML